jgi:hypothetical protein
VYPTDDCISCGHPGEVSLAHRSTSISYEASVTGHSVQPGPASETPRAMFGLRGLSELGSRLFQTARVHYGAFPILAVSRQLCTLALFESA